MTFSAAAADERVLDVTVGDDALSVSLRDGRVISVPLAWYPRLLSATPAQRNNWKIAGGGYGIHWPDVDEDLSTEGLLRGAISAEANAAYTALGLSGREQQVVLMLASGLTNKEIASRLRISGAAVRGHLERVARKLGVGDRTLTKDLLLQRVANVDFRSLRVQ